MTLQLPFSVMPVQNLTKSLTSDPVSAVFVQYKEFGKAKVGFSALDLGIIIYKNKPRKLSVNLDKIRKTVFFREITVKVFVAE